MMFRAYVELVRELYKEVFESQLSCGYLLLSDFWMPKMPKKIEAEFH